MPRGGHTGIRIALACPPGLHQQLSDWATAEERPVASLAMALIEQGIRQAQVDGLIPGPTETLKEHFERLEKEREPDEPKTADEILSSLSPDATAEEKKAALAEILTLMGGDGI